MFESINSSTDFSWYPSSTDAYAPPPPEFSADYEYGLADALNFCTNSADIAAPTSRSTRPRRESTSSFSELCEGPNGGGGVDGFEDNFMNFQPRDEPSQWYEQCGIITDITNDTQHHREQFDDDNINVDAAPEGPARGSGGIEDDGCFGYSRFATPVMAEGSMPAMQRQSASSSANAVHSAGRTGGCPAGWNNTREQTPTGLSTGGPLQLDNRCNEYNYWDPSGLVAIPTKQFGCRTHPILPSI